MNTETLLFLSLEPTRKPVSCECTAVISAPSILKFTRANKAMLLLFLFLLIGARLSILKLAWLLAILFSSWHHGIYKRERNKRKDG